LQAPTRFSHNRTGSASFHKAEDECLKEEDKEEEEEKPRVEKIIDEEDEMILKLPLKGDYKRYEAEVRRAIEEKEKKYYKTFVELKVVYLLCSKCEPTQHKISP
jgi:hypothetical protein